MPITWLITQYLRARRLWHARRIMWAALRLGLLTGIAATVKQRAKRTAVKCTQQAPDKWEEN